MSTTTDNSATSIRTSTAANLSSTSNAISTTINIYTTPILTSTAASLSSYFNAANHASTFSSTSSIPDTTASHVSTTTTANTTSGVYTISSTLPSSSTASRTSTLAKPTTYNPTTAISSVNVGLVKCLDAADFYNGDIITVRCPSSCDVSPLVWGTDIYEIYSDICASAIHVGRITSSGGYVTYQKLPAQDWYQGTKRNGILSYDLSYGEGSFTFL
ncbi:cysteine-rich secretory protein LCCL domain-containing 2-like [Pelobates fuscus]|uniref:cysteine-rich secretory protein LCCL domain-containing 2-like n=1 Tax=Pelobates fuscus TaxID=191477 RepID=UPI002FE4F01B